MARVLVIHSDPECLDGIRQSLITGNHAVFAASSAHEGLHHAREQGIDIILLDIDLLDMDGRVVAALLRTQPKLARVPILGLTNHQNPDYLQLAHAFGCTGTITNPIDTQNLPQELSRFLEVQ